MSSTLPLQASDLRLIRPLGKGGDGSVSLYLRRSNSTFVAVKTPLKESKHYIKAVQQEIEIMKNLSCAYIVSYLGHDDEWTGFKPAIFYEYCGLGDVHFYRKELAKDRAQIPEETVWKLFSDVAQGLHYLHQQDPPLVHGDLKPANILVAQPKDCRGSFSILPDFKIADFGRTVEYLQKYDVTKRWRGTHEYAPPRKEQLENLTPKADIWCLGATIQSFALGTLPIQSYEAFMKDYRVRTGTNLAVEGPPDWNESRWREQIPVKYRPLNVTLKVLQLRHDWPGDSSTLKPGKYSGSLNLWYAKCMNKTTSERITSAQLKQHFVPIALQKIKEIQGGKGPLAPATSNSEGASANPKPFQLNPRANPWHHGQQHRTQLRQLGHTSPPRPKLTPYAALMPRADERLPSPAMMRPPRPKLVFSAARKAQLKAEVQPAAQKSQANNGKELDHVTREMKRAQVDQPPPSGAALLVQKDPESPTKVLMDEIRERNRARIGQLQLLRPVLLLQHLPLQHLPLQHLSLQQDFQNPTKALTDKVQELNPAKPSLPPYMPGWVQPHDRHPAETSSEQRREDQKYLNDMEEVLEENGKEAPSDSV